MTLAFKTKGYRPSTICRLEGTQTIVCATPVAPAKDTGSAPCPNLLQNTAFWQ